MQLVSFRVGEYLFGIDILIALEINRNLNLTPVERVPDYIRGLINLRGQIVTVLDLGVKLGMEPLQEKPTSSCVILKNDSEISRIHSSRKFSAKLNTYSVGLFVDKIGEVITIDESEIEKPSRLTNDLASSLVSGVVRLKNELLIMLSPEEILASEENSVMAETNGSVY